MSTDQPTARPHRRARPPNGRTRRRQTRPDGPDVARLPTEALWALRASHRQAVDEELMRRLSPLARKLARRYRSANEPFEDLVQVASLGLLLAIERFDPEHGTKFVSFAIPTILGELKRYFRDTGWAVHVPRGAQELALKVEKAADILTDRLGRAPQIDELAHYLEIDEEAVLEGLEVRNAHFGTSIDAPVRADDSSEVPLAETLGAPDERYELVNAVSQLRDGLRRLPFQERQAVTLRVSENLKQAEIAQRLGCSQMQVSRLLSRAARRIDDTPG